MAIGKGAEHENIPVCVIRTRFVLELVASECRRMFLPRHITHILRPIRVLETNADMERRLLVAEKATDFKGVLDVTPIHRGTRDDKLEKPVGAGRELLLLLRAFPKQTGVRVAELGSADEDAVEFTTTLLSRRPHLRAKLLGKVIRTETSEELRSVHLHFVPLSVQGAVLSTQTSKCF